MRYGGSSPETGRCPKTSKSNPYQTLGGDVGELPPVAHFHLLVPWESFIYLESTGDIDRDTQNRVIDN